MAIRTGSSASFWAYSRRASAWMRRMISARSRPAQSAGSMATVNL